MKAFSAKGRVSSWLKDIPVRVIINDKAALFGAGRVAALALAGKQASSLTVTWPVKSLELNLDAQLDLPRRLI